MSYDTNRAIEAEASVIGAMLIDEDVVGPALAELDPKDFLHEPYRRVFLAGNPEVVREFCQSLTRPRVSRLLFQVDDPRTLPRQRDFVVDFCAGALTSYFIELCASRKPLDWAEVRCCLGGLLEVLRPAEDLCLQVQAG